MSRHILAAAMLSGLLMGTALPAYAQVTDQTDQSEEDWRKSRKKRGSTDIFKPNTTTSGVGIGTIGDVKPVSPVERLPSESRRHLMKKRAEAIANSPDGDISQAEYEPSEAAKSDEALMRDEKEAWDVITTDMEGSGGQATTPSPGGPNKVAVAGRNGTAPAPGSRGGSTATLQQIMDAIKSGRMGNGSGGGQGDGDGTGRSPRPGASAGVGTLPVGLPGGMGQGRQPGAQPGGGAQQGQGQQAGGTPTGGGSQGQPQGDAQGGADASAPGQGQSQGQSANSGAAQGQDQSNSGASASDGAQGAQSSSAQASASAGAAGQPSAPRTREELSPLERMRRAREDREAGGSERSASDYLGGRRTRDD